MFGSRSRSSAHDYKVSDGGEDDVEWLKLFIQLTGGYNDVVSENRSRTNLSHIDETQDDVDSRPCVINQVLQSSPRQLNKFSLSYT